MGGATTRSRWSLWWAVGVSVWLLVVPSMLVVVRLAVPSDGLPVVEPSGSLAEGLVRVQPPAPVAGVVSGDAIVAVGGRLVDELLDRPESRSVAAGDELRYRVRRGDVERDVPVVLRDRRQFADLAADRAPLLVAMLGFFMLGAWLVWRRPGEAAAHAFLVLGAALVSLQLMQLSFVEPLDLFARPWAVAWSVVGLAAFMVMGVAALSFASTFPSTGGRPGWWSSPAVCAVPVLMMVVVALAYLFGWLSTAAISVVDGAAGIVWMATTLLAVVVAVGRWWRYRTDLVARRQMQVVLLGFAATFVPLLLLNVIPNDGPEVGFALLVLPFPIAVVTAIVRDDLFGLDVVLNRTIVLVLSTVVLLAVYAAVVVATIALTNDRGPWVAIPAAGTVAVLFAPVRQRAQRWVDHRLFGFGSDPAIVFHRLGIRLSGLAEPDALMAAVVDSVTESLRLPYAAIETQTAGARVLVEQRGSPTDAVEWFDLLAGEDAVGRLGVSPRRDARTLTPGERALLQDLARHVAVVAQLARVMNQLRAAQRQLIVARENERHRIQRDLHDRIGPVLVGMSLQLSVAVDAANSPDLAELLTGLQREASRATDDLRRLVRNLRPAELAEIGLSTAVEAAAARFSASGDLRFEVEIPLRLPDLSTAIEDGVYHVCIEAMANAVRHSNARRGVVRITPRVGGGLDVTIEDDGTGIDAKYNPGTGLVSMTERVTAIGGLLDVRSGDGRGTQVHVQILGNGSFDV